MTNSTAAVRVKRGHSQPLGVHYIHNQGFNFALFSRHAMKVSLCLFQPDGKTLWSEIILDPNEDKSGDIWHVLVPEMPEGLLYAYRLDGVLDQSQGIEYKSDRLLLDPYAKAISTTNIWNEGHSVKNPPEYKPLGAVVGSDFEWENDRHPKIPREDLIIYEMHVRGFTQDSSSHVAHPGTFLGVIEKIPHLVELGVNAVELLPIFEFNEREWNHVNPKTKELLSNYWGYSTVNFFSPMNRYGSTSKPGVAATDFKQLVKALHASQIEVILDVVFNHTAEGNKQGPVLSFKGIDNSIYYILDHGEYLDFTGCGHTVNCNHPVVRQFILDCLRYWVFEMHVDGFRFDLSSIFSRDKKGVPISNAPLIDLIAEDPVLRDIKIIAEPWDVGGLYQVGGFYPSSARWSEWNGKYRDCVRRFIKGQPGQVGEFATRLCGSEDLFSGRSPLCSLNFVTAHDGFSLYDLVSYNQKHNLDNGESNRDGLNYNDSWNCGVEGPTKSVKINALRERQMRNFHMALMLSLGMPMIVMGDEYGHTKLGNNNSWCQDNSLNWFHWDMLEKNPGFYRFYKMMIQFRKDNPLLKRSHFIKESDIVWHGPKSFAPEWGGDRKLVAFCMKDFEKGEDIYAAFNASEEPVIVELPDLEQPKAWKMIINTSNPSPEDIIAEKDAKSVTDALVTIPPHSAVLLKAI